MEGLYAFVSKGVFGGFFGLARVFGLARRALGGCWVMYGEAVCFSVLECSRTSQGSAD